MNTYLNSQDDLYLIFCLEIIIKFYDIRFEDSEENKEEFKEEFPTLKLSENIKNLLPKHIWEKIFLLTEHPNFKLNIFSSYIINYIKPDFLTEKMKEKANFIKLKKEELSEVKNYFNDKFGILTVKKITENHNFNNLITSITSLNLLNNNNNYNFNHNINYNLNFANQMNNILADSNNFSSLNLENNNILNNPNFNGLQEQIVNDGETYSIKGIWYSNSEMLSLRNYIKESIINIGKLRNDLSNTYKSINPYDDKEDYDMCNKRHAENEIGDDIDLIEIIPENDNFEENEFEENIDLNNVQLKKHSIPSSNGNIYKNSNNNLRKNQNFSSNNNYENEAGLYYDKERDEYLDFAELGVLEVDDDIFENFDEENIPVIKNIYKRKKGSAEKFKTNQNNRNKFLNSQMNNENNNNNFNDGPNSSLLLNNNNKINNNCYGINQGIQTNSNKNLGKNHSQNSIQNYININHSENAISESYSNF